MKTTLTLLLLAAQGAAVPEPPVLIGAKPLTSENHPPPAKSAIVAPPPFRRTQDRATYLRESFGVLPSTPSQTPAAPAAQSREEAFAMLLKSMRDKRMESSREKSNRLKRSDHPLENEALEFLDQALGGSNATNPVARSVHRHLASETGRQELLTALGLSQNRKNR